MTQENTHSQFDEIDLLCSLRVECIVQCEDGRQVVYHDEKKNRIILAGFCVFVFGEEDDPPEMFKPNRIYGEWNDLDSISVDFRRVYACLKRKTRAIKVWIAKKIDIATAFPPMKREI
jgi:hypothetical protein